MRLNRLTLLLLLAVVSSLVITVGIWNFRSDLVLHSSKPISSLGQPVIQPINPSILEQAPGGQANIEIAKGKVYRNEQYGISFVYPQGLSLSEIERDNQGKLLRLSLEVPLQENQIVSLEVSCIEPDHVPEELWQSNFKTLGERYWYTGAAAYTLGERLEEFDLGPWRLIAFKQGCYECYGEPDLRKDRFLAVACASGKNERNNHSARCLQIATEDTMGNELNQIQEFFLTQFLPSFKLDTNFGNTRMCSGRGEANG